MVAIADPRACRRANETGLRNHLLATKRERAGIVEHIIERRE